MVLVAATLIGCGDGDGAEQEAPLGTERQRMEDEGASSNPERSGDAGTVSADPTEAPRDVEVHLTEFEIGMPTILKPGSHLFKIKNDGKEPHGLTVEGNGTSATLPTAAQPGETVTLPVDLAPGSYNAFCPLDGHGDRGMTVAFTVSE
jgi:hypothetical protein